MIGDILCGIIKFISGANVRWIDCPCENKQRIYFANHSSHLDAFVLWAALPLEMRRHTRVIAAKDYWEKTWLRRLISHKIYNPLLIERSELPSHESPNHPINQIVSVLDQNYSIVLFPEGTRNEEGGIKPFKSGLYHICQKRPHIELVPVYLENLNRILPKGEILFVPIIGSVTFGKPIKLFPGETKEQFLERARKGIIELERI
jgi:1-acyl-sn-glycerol-3-phosphate acyltransferase